MSLILYVEDDAILQMDGGLVLQSAGYEVQLAGDGAEACATLQRLGQHLSMLMTDIQLGGSVDGWDVADMARAINENVPVLYMTGSESGAFAARGATQGVMISKPFGWPQVLRSISDLLR
jgi:CheY-like chemotaxis protein